MIWADFYTKLQVFGICLLMLSLIIMLMRMKLIDNNDRLGICTPTPSDAACMARYIVHESDWCSLAYISYEGDTSNYPLARVYSVSDGSVNVCTGNIYLMVSPLDVTVKDLKLNNNCSVIMSLAQEKYCSKNKYDPQDPRCAQVVLTGNFIFIKKNTSEWVEAQSALWSRHPVMEHWYHDQPAHKFQFAKLLIKDIYVVDYFGGRKYPSIESYYNATPC